MMCRVCDGQEGLSGRGSRSELVVLTRPWGFRLPLTAVLSCVQCWQLESRENFSQGRSPDESKP